MENELSRGRMPVAARITDKLKAHPLIVSAAAAGACGALCALARITGECAPFGAAFLAAVPVPLLIPSAAGAVLGYLIPGLDASYRSIAALLIVLAARLATGNARWERRPGWLASALATAGVLAAGVLPVIYSRPLVYDVIMWCTQVVMAGAAAGFMDRAFADVKKGGLTLSGIFGGAHAPAVVMGSVLLMGLDSIAAAGVSAGRITAAAVILIAACSGSEALSALTGVLAGLVIGFSTGDFELYVTTYGLGGLLAGLFSSFGRYGSAAVFTLYCGCFCMFSRGTPAGLIEAALGSVLFLTIPAGWLAAAQRPARSGAAGEILRAAARERLTAVSGALRDISSTTCEVAGRLNRAKSGSSEEICQSVCRSVCRRCPYSGACWREEPELTSAALMRGIGILRSTGMLTGKELADGLGRCRRRDEIATVLTSEYRRAAARAEEGARTERLRSVLTEQYEGIGMALDSMAEEIGRMQVLPAAETLRRVMEGDGLDPRQLVCWRDENGCVRIRVCIPRSRSMGIELQALTQKLSSAAGTALSTPKKVYEDSELILDFTQKKLYSCEFGCCQISAEGCPHCGDTLRRVDCGGMTHLLLSDGMGSGPSAALDSAMTAAIASRLLEAEIDHQSALRLINSALMVRTGGESLATLDAARVNLYTGRADLFKAGAAPTVILKNGRASCTEAGSLPAGILDGVRFEATGLQLSAGDMLVMMSDGAAQESCDWMLPLIEKYRDEDPDDLCRRLARTAKLRRADGREDDITVAALIIKKA